MSELITGAVVTLAVAGGTAGIQEAVKHWAAGQLHSKK